MPTSERGWGHDAVARGTWAGIPVPLPTWGLSRHTTGGLLLLRAQQISRSDPFRSRTPTQPMARHEWKAVWSMAAHWIAGWDEQRLVAWLLSPPPVLVRCGRLLHRVEVLDDGVALPHHRSLDVEAELAVAALGGTALGCVSALSAVGQPWLADGDLRVRLLAWLVLLRHELADTGSLAEADRRVLERVAAGLAA